jgi:hypothetical protein
MRLLARIEELEDGLRAKKTERHVWYTSYQPRDDADRLWGLISGCPNPPPMEHISFQKVPDEEAREKARRELRELYAQLEKEYRSCRWFQLFRRLRLTTLLGRPSYDEVMEQRETSQQAG